MSYSNLETNVLGSLMVSGSSWDRGGHMLKPEDFYDNNNREVFSAIRELVTGGTTPDTIAVAEYLERNKTPYPGPQFLAQISNNATAVANIESHCNLLKDASMQRVIKQTALQMQNLSGSGKEQLIQVQALLAAMEAQDPREPKMLKECVSEWIAALTERANNDSNTIGRMTGFCDVDRRTGGFRAGDLIVLAGRPAMAKTALSTAIIKTVAMKGGICAMFSLEMDNGSLMDRVIANISGVGLGVIRNGSMSDTDWPRVTGAAQKAAELKWLIDDEPSLTIQEIHSRARRIKRKHGLDLIVVDYLQLVETDRRYDSRRDHVAEVSRTLKRMAKDLQVPVIALSQLNRKCEERNDKRPLMSDLAESGSVEQDADAIGFLYRDEVYNEHTERKGICELIWRKVRNGSPGTDFLSFDGPTQRFNQIDRNTVPQSTSTAVAKFKQPYSQDRYKRSGT